MMNKKQMAILARGAERAAVNLAAEGRTMLAAEATELAGALTEAAGKRAVAWNDAEAAAVAERVARGARAAVERLGQLGKLPPKAQAEWDAKARINRRSP